MEIEIHSFRHAETILKNEYIDQYNEVIDILKRVTEKEIIKKFESINFEKEKKEKQNKSISEALNKILKEKFKQKEWQTESKIFKDKNFRNKTWKLDFAKRDISLEVAFNHGTVAAWNLIKPTIAGELNHIEKEINTKIGIIITATEELKKSGGFDNAIGTFESYMKYIKALNNILTIPILLIGLKSLKSFEIEHIKNEKNKNKGIVKLKK